MVASRGPVTFVLASALALAGCDGTLFEGPAGPTGSIRNPGPTSCEADEIVLGSAPMRRLSAPEFLHSMRDLFPASVRPELPELPPDARVSGFENDAHGLGPSDVLVSRWEEIVFRYTRDLTASTARLAALLPCATSATDAASQRACGETLVRDFGRRAYRRPLRDDEVTRYTAFFEEQRVAIDFLAAVQLTTMAILESPWFLYRIELPGEGAPATGDRVALDSFQLASRLSFFLWESTPDDALLDAAAAGELSTPEQIETHARRLLEDPRAREAVLDFHRQWLELDRIVELNEHATRHPDRYPSWGPAAREAVRAEQDRFIEGVLFEGEGTLGALLTSRRTWVNASLAEIYGVPGPADDATWMETTLPENERSGFLTRAAFLASHAHAVNGSPPLRGIFVLTRLLCEPRPTPPMNADLTPPVQEPGAPPATNRQLFEERTAPAQCVGCHTRIDGIGFGFESYDAIGAYRELDNGIAVDASGNITGTDVDGPYVGAVELSEALAESERVRACTTRMWVRFAMGRAPEASDACLLGRLEDRFAQSDGDVRDLMLGIVTSPEFRHRPLASE